MSVNIRDFSIKCGNCGMYQTLCGFERREGLHVYRYECENDICAPEVTCTLLEVAAEIDEFARRDPGRNTDRQEEMDSEQARSEDG